MKTTDGSMYILIQLVMVRERGRGQFTLSLTVNGTGTHQVDKLVNDARKKDRREEKI